MQLYEARSKSNQSIGATVQQPAELQVSSQCVPLVVRRLFPDEFVNHVDVFLEVLAVADD